MIAAEKFLFRIINIKEERAVNFSFSTSHFQFPISFLIPHSEEPITRSFPFYNPHSTIPILQSPFYNPHSTIPILQSPFYNPHSTIPILQFPFNDLHSWFAADVIRLCKLSAAMLVLISGVKFPANISPSLSCLLSNTFVLWMFPAKKIQNHKRIFSLGYLCF